jgi:hypothetical protein
MNAIRIQLLVTSVRAPLIERWAAKSFSYQLSQEGYTTKPAPRRSYEVWSEKAKKHGFSPEEVVVVVVVVVVKVAMGYSYVVVDPNDSTLLLPLSRPQYVALLHVVLTRRIKLIVLLGPEDARYPEGGT